MVKSQVRSWSGRAAKLHRCVQILNGTSWVFWAALAYWRGERIAMAWDTLLEPSGGFGELPFGARASITRHDLHAGTCMRKCRLGDTALRWPVTPCWSCLIPSGFASGTGSAITGSKAALQKIHRSGYSWLKSIRSGYSLLKPA